MNTDVKVKVRYNTKTMNLLKQAPNKITFSIARQYLDIVTPSIPRDTGRMRLETLRYGVKPIENGYQLCSNTNYANYVYNMDNNTTNWTTPGTESQWFIREWQRKGQGICMNAIKRN